MKSVKQNVVCVEIEKTLFAKSRGSFYFFLSSRWRFVWLPRVCDRTLNGWTNVTATHKLVHNGIAVVAVVSHVFDLVLSPVEVQVFVLIEMKTFSYNFTLSDMSNQFVDDLLLLDACAEHKRLNHSLISYFQFLLVSSFTSIPLHTIIQIILCVCVYHNYNASRLA